MSRTPLFKVYGHIHPVDVALYAGLERICASALPDTEDIPVLEKDGDMARISFEGTYFPDTEALDFLSARLDPLHQGKLDILDMDGWRMTRHVFRDGRIQSQTVPLNHVLAHSGL